VDGTILAAIGIPTCVFYLGSIFFSGRQVPPLSLLITMTQRYVHPSPEQVASAVKALEELNKAGMENLEKAAENSPQIPPQHVN
jgi:hypothetical protein